jgi:hypothetical protein
MLELMRDPSRRRRFSAAAVERTEQFSPARIGARWEELLTELRAADQPPRRFDSFRRSR